MSFYTSVFEGDFSINEVEFNGNSQLVLEETAENDFQRRTAYAGPRFGDLDEVSSDFTNFCSHAVYILQEIILT